MIASYPSIYVLGHRALAAIKAALLSWAWPKVQRGVTAGLAEWYKEELLKRQFEVTPT